MFQNPSSAYYGFVEGFGPSEAAHQDAEHGPLQPCPRALQPSFFVLLPDVGSGPASRTTARRSSIAEAPRNPSVPWVSPRSRGPGHPASWPRLGPVGGRGTPVCPDLLQARQGRSQFGEDRRRTLPILHRSGVHRQDQGQPEGIDPRVPRSPLALVPAVLPPRPTALRRLHGRTVDPPPPPAVGVEHRPSRARAGPRNAATRSPYRPWSRHQYKEYRTVEGAETPGGSARHWQPVIHGYGSACTPSRRDLPHGDDPLRNGQGRAAPCPLTGALSRVSSSAQRVSWCARTSRQRTAVFRVRQGHACSNLSLDPFPRVRNTRPRNHQCVPLCRVARQIEQPDTRQGVAPCARRIGGTPCFRTGGCNGPVPAGAGTPRSRTHAC